MRILVSAGPTREPIDPVRYVSNRSSGKMGYAIAAAAARRGHAVRLVSGPVAIEPPAGVAIERVETTRQMLDSLRGHVDWCQILIMAAAPADWRPAETSAHKIKKGTVVPPLRLVTNPDILRELHASKADRLFVGFAAETTDLIGEARRKLAAKGVDLIVANEVGQPDSGFEADTNRVTLVSKAGVEPWPLLAKTEVADRLLDWVERQAGQRKPERLRRLQNPSSTGGPAQPRPPCAGVTQGTSPRRANLR